MEDLKSFIEEVDFYLSIPISIESNYYTLGIGDWNDMIIQGLPEKLHRSTSINRLIFYSL